MDTSLSMNRLCPPERGSAQISEIVKNLDSGKQQLGMNNLVYKKSYVDKISEFTTQDTMPNNHLSRSRLLQRCQILYNKVFLAYSKHQFFTKWAIYDPKQSIQHATFPQNILNYFLIAPGYLFPLSKHHNSLRALPC